MEDAGGCNQGGLSAESVGIKGNTNRADIHNCFTIQPYLLSAARGGGKERSKKLNSLSFSLI